jgi:phosphoribosylaminoimidazole-succinocarboxamide synthase
MPDAAALHVASGKVREIYELDQERLLLVTSDRISTFDVILPTEIPDKGRVLTGLSGFWFACTRDVVPNHLLALRPDGRSTEARRLRMLPIECVVRGYLAGSGWKEYQKSGTVCGVGLPKGLQLSSKLPEPIFTPATKAQEGHDENIDFDRMASIVGRGVAERLRDVSLAIYQAAAAHAESRGLILADTKFEFGERDGAIVWIDEALSPDSSRYWPIDAYREGVAQDSFDKQVIRDYLDSIGWDRNPPPPPLPEPVIEKTARRYEEALARITEDGGTR